MPDALEFSNLPYAVVIAIIFTAAAFGILGYMIASRRIKQTLVAFLIRFAISFLLLLLLETAILAIWPSVHEKLGNITATLAGGILSSVGVSESVSGSTITLHEPLLVFSVDAACLGGMLLWAYIGLVFAESRATGKQRLAGIALGLVILLGFNFFRIVWSIYLEWLTDVHVHDYFYIVNMAFVLLVWMGWLRTLKPNSLSSVKPSSRQEAVPKTWGE